MNCPKCKNPIENNAFVCEWCGASFVFTHNNKYAKINTDIEDEFSCMDRKALKRYISDFFSDIKDMETISDDDMRFIIREKLKDEEEELKNISIKCPKCKNQISIDSQICEWCGNEIY